MKIDIRGEGPHQGNRLYQYRSLKNFGVLSEKHWKILDRILIPVVVGTSKGLTRGTAGKYSGFILPGHI
ncbi:MAG: hypothetical protein WAK10_09460, partial [Methanoregula sp.]